MGRTNPTFRDMVKGVRERWKKYRRALRRKDKQHFDELFEYADRHSDAGGYLNPDNPTDAILFSMMLEQQKHINELEQKIDEQRKVIESSKKFQESDRSEDVVES